MNLCNWGPDEPETVQIANKGNNNGHHMHSWMRYWDNNRQRPNGLKVSISTCQGKGDQYGDMTNVSSIHNNSYMSHNFSQYGNTYDQRGYNYGSFGSNPQYSGFYDQNQYWSAQRSRRDERMVS